MSGLAQMYDLRDEKQAKEYLEKLGIEYRFQCFHEKLPDGCHRLADFLETFRKEVEKAGNVFQENCVSNNYGHSCFKYGHYNLKGTGCEKNVSEAAKYYEMACDNKYYPGCYNAGMLLLKGKVDKSLTSRPHNVRGTELLNTGCEGDNASCCSRLGIMYLVGKDGLNRDMKEAFKYTKKACDLGHIYSCANLSQMYKRGEGTSKNEELAEQFKKRAQQLLKDARESELEIEFQQTAR